MQRQGGCPPKAKPKTKPKPAATAPDDGEDGGQEEPEEEEDPGAEMTTKSGIRWSDGCFGHGCFGMAASVLQLWEKNLRPVAYTGREK